MKYSTNTPQRTQALNEGQITRHTPFKSLRGKTVYINITTNIINR